MATPYARYVPCTPAQGRTVRKITERWGTRLGQTHRERAQAGFHPYGVWDDGTRGYDFANRHHVYVMPDRRRPGRYAIQLHHPDTGLTGKSGRKQGLTEQQVSALLEQVAQLPLHSQTA